MMVKKFELERWLKEFNNGLLVYEFDDNYSKKDLVEYVDMYLTWLVKKYGLDISNKLGEDRSFNLVSKKDCDKR